MAAQQPRHQDAEQQNHERRDNDQCDHGASFSRRSQYRSGPGPRGGTAARARGDSSGILRSVPADDLFLPEPEPREVRYTVISVDDHVVEPPTCSRAGCPPRWRTAPRASSRTPEGHQVWEFEGERYTQVGMNAVAGRRPETYGLEPFRFDQMRPGCYDVDARVRDMDINGVWASVNFPSMITGFCGRVFFDAQDRELGLACVRAWNDWLFEEWYCAHPDRIVPLGITYLADPELAAAEIRRNAERGFTSVTFPERPHEIGLPSLWDREHWDPIIEAVRRDRHRDLASTSAARA